MADVLLRTSGGSSAVLLIPPARGDSTDAGQLGIDAPGFQALSLGPVIFRRTRPVMQEGKPAKYELLVSASAVAQQVGLLQLDSADALFSSVAGIVVSGLSLLIEEWACSASLGRPVVFRLILRTAEPQSFTK